MRYDNQLPIVKKYSTNIAALQNTGVLYQIWHYEILWCILLICRGCMEHGWKDVASYVQKHIAPWAICYKPRASSRHATWGPRSCETRLFSCFSCIPMEVCDVNLYTSNYGVFREFLGKRPSVVFSDQSWVGYTCLLGAIPTILNGLFHI